MSRNDLAEKLRRFEAARDVGESATYDLCMELIGQQLAQQRRILLLWALTIVGLRVTLETTRTV